jgi:hypothetical protein
MPKRFSQTPVGTIIRENHLDSEVKYIAFRRAHRELKLPAIIEVHELHAMFAASTLGSRTSKAKAAAARANGGKGGRPSKQMMADTRKYRLMTVLTTEERIKMLEQEIRDKVPRSRQAAVREAVLKEYRRTGATSAAREILGDKLGGRPPKKAKNK